MLTESDLVSKLWPEIITAVAACAVLIVGVTRRRTASGLAPLIAMFGLATALVAVGVAMRDAGVGDAAAGYGSVVGSSLALGTKAIVLLVGLAIVLVAWDLGSLRDRADLLAMVLFSICGVLLVASSGDLIVLLLALEMVSMPTYILVAIGRAKPQAQEAGLKYFFLGAMAAAITIYGMSFLYGATGETRIAGIAAAFQAASGERAALLILGLVLTIVGMSFKVAAVPLHFYAPDVYEGAATPVTGLLGFLPKIAGFVALVKVLSVAGWLQGGDLPAGCVTLLAVLAVITMTVGNTVALMQRSIKRMLAYSSIAHSGYMMLGLVVGPAILGRRDGVGAMMFYMGIYGITNLGAFAVLAILQLRDDSAEHIDDLAGLGRRHPWVALVMAVCVLSLMGMPPLAGFWGKAYLFSAVWSMQTDLAVWLVIIAVLNSAIGAGYYLRIITAMYLREPIWRPTLGRSPMVRLGAVVCAALVLLIGLRPSRALSLASYCSRQFRAAAPRFERVEADRADNTTQADAPPAKAVL